MPAKDTLLQCRQLPDTVITVFITSVSAVNEEEDDYDDGDGDFQYLQPSRRHVTGPKV